MLQYSASKLESPYPFVPLESVVEFIRNGASIKQEDDAGGLPITRIETISNHVIDSDKVGYAGILPGEHDDYLLEKGDILFSHINSTKHIGKCALYGGMPEILVHGMNLLCVRPKHEVISSNYLLAAIRHPIFKVQLSKIIKPSVNQSSVTVSHLKTLKIPLPPLPIQKQIAALLEKADTLRSQCKQMEQELNQLAQSVFLEMFGDYRKSDVSVTPLGEIADVCSGVTKGQNLEGKETVIAPYMRVANVQDGHIDLSEIKKIEAKKSDYEKYLLEVGDVLLTEGGDFDKLGRGAVWEGKVSNCIHQNHVFRVRLNHEHLPKYFEYLLQTPYAKQYFLKCAKKTTNLASINITQLKALPVPKEEKEDQQRFVDFIEMRDKKMESLKKTQSYYEDLFNSLMQRAFSGKLNLTKAA
ncbi:MAG: restriction endonuclease subunit S [Candidatus Thiodiazotropha sp.]